MELKPIQKLKTNKIIRFLFFPLIIARRFYHMQRNKEIVIFQKLFANVKEGSLIVSINDISGSYEIDARSHLLQRILINKNYEPKTVSSIKRFIDYNKDIINVGANVGIFTIMMAELIDVNAKVLAIEPTPLAFKYLKKNVERNCQTNKVLFYNGICTDKKGAYSINTIVGKEEYSSIGDSIHMNHLNENIIKINVDGETVDNLVNKYTLNPGLLVIDVEGAEMKVLKGAEETLLTHKPIIISELDDQLLNNQDTSTKEVIGFLSGLGYIIRNVENGKVIGYPFTGNIIAISV